MLPAGPDPTMSTSKRLSIIALSACSLELYCQARGGLVERTATDPSRFAQDLFRPLPRRYDVLEELLSLGQNRRWRREMIAHVDDGDPSAILDVATGTAGVALALTRRTAAQITGIDITEAMLRRGHGRVARVGAADRVRLLVGQAERLPFPDRSFDALTFTYLLRYVSDPAGDASRTRTRPQAGRGDGKSGVLGSGDAVLAVLVVALYPRRVARCRLCHGRS